MVPLRLSLLLALLSLLVLLTLPLLFAKGARCTALRSASYGLTTAV